MSFLFESFKLGEAFQLRLGGNTIQPLQRGNSSILLLIKRRLWFVARISTFHIVTKFANTCQ